MKLISEELRSALIEQWAHEVYNSHLYLFIMAYLRNKGLDNISKLFLNQFEEEQSHAKMILDLLTDLNANFFAPPIEEISDTIEGFVHIAKIYLEREHSTTLSLNSLKQLAIDDFCPVVEERIRQMILLQQHEYEEATTFFDKAEILGEDWKAIMLYDSSLGGD